MKIFVGGSLKDVPVYPDLCTDFVEALAEEIVARGHTLLTGCRGSLDKAIAEAAHRRLAASEIDPREQLLSYRLKDSEPVHRLGRVLVSRRSDWELTHPDLSPPEQIATADVTVFVAGGKGTYFAANWARIADKPILGVAQFGGAASNVFERERDRFTSRYSQFVDASGFDDLSQDTDNAAQLAKDIVDLCGKIITSDKVFSIMSFRPEFQDLFASYCAVCERYGFVAERTDEAQSSERIIPRILNGIRKSAFVLADVSEVSSNVFYEIGYAEGLGRPVIVTAKRGTKLPFDLADIPVIFWTDQKDLREQLGRRLDELAPVVRRRESRLADGND